MSIGFYNFAALHHADFQKKVIERFEDIVKNNAFVEGKYNAMFEQEFAQMQGSKHCLLLANGTDALEIALSAYGVGQGDVVAIAAISFYATAECVYNVGAKPVFVDVDPKTGLIDTNSLKRIVEKHKVKAVIAVHIYGLPAPMAEVEKICLPRGIKIIEDGAQSQGGFYAENRPIGSSNNLITYSFYPTKNLGAFGDAGAILTNDSELAEKIVSIRNHGRSPKGHTVIGRNSRCDHMQAAVLHLKLEEIEAQNEKRKGIAKQYLKALEGLGLRLVPQEFINLSSWHLFPIGLKNRDQKYALKEFLGQKGIATALFYEKAMPEEATLLDVPGEKEHALHFAATTLCLPMNPFLGEAEILTIATEIKTFLDK